MDSNRIITKGSLAGIARKPFLHFTQELAFFADGTIRMTVDAHKKEELNIFFPHFGCEIVSPVKNDGQFECTVSHYVSLSLSAATPISELVPNGYTNIQIDYKGLGIGSYSCWPALAEKYQLLETDTHFEVFLR